MVKLNFDFSDPFKGGSASKEGEVFQEEQRDTKNTNSKNQKKEEHLSHSHEHEITQSVKNQAEVIAKNNKKEVEAVFYNYAIDESTETEIDQTNGEAVTPKKKVNNPKKRKNERRKKGQVPKIKTSRILSILMLLASICIFGAIYLQQNSNNSNDNSIGELNNSTTINLDQDKLMSEEAQNRYLSGANFSIPIDEFVKTSIILSQSNVEGVSVTIFNINDSSFSIYSSELEIEEFVTKIPEINPDFVGLEAVSTTQQFSNDRVRIYKSDDLVHLIASDIKNDNLDEDYVLDNIIIN